MKIGVTLALFISLGKTASENILLIVLVKWTEKAGLIILRTLAETLSSPIAVLLLMRGYIIVHLFLRDRLEYERFDFWHSFFYFVDTIMIHDFMIT